MCVSAFGAYVATQSSPTSIPDSGTANPYPSTIDLTKSNILGSVEKVTVTVNGVTHPYAPDVGMLLVGPNGKAVVLLSDSGGNPGGSSVLNNEQFVFSDDATGLAPFNSPLVSGSSYKPTDNGGLSFTAPAPPSPYSSTLTSAFQGINPNGVWGLYVLDTTPGPPTTLTPAIGSWSLSLETTPIFDVATNLSTIKTTVFGGNPLTTFVDENSSVAVNLVLQDSSTPPGNLTVSATKITDLATNFSSSVSGQNATLTISPNAFTFGTNTLTITVSDGIGSATTNITLAVRHVNQAPTIALSTNAVTAVAGFMTTNIIVATVADPDINFDANAVKNLNLTATSSNPLVVSPSGVFFTTLTAGGDQRAISIVPMAGSGTATVTINVDDGKLTNSQTIAVTVLPVPYPLFANTTEIDAPAAGSGSSTIAIPNNTISGLVGAVNVLLNGVKGVVPSSATFTLTAPGGKSVILLQTPASPTSAENYGQIQFIDGASGSLPNNNNETNTIKLAPAPGHLSDLGGVNPNGTWTLKFDNAAATDAKIINGWTLNIQAAPTVGAIADVRAAEETTQQVTFTVGDIDGTVTNVTGRVVGNAGLAKITGTVSGNSATLTIQGNFNQFGTNTVEVVAEDNNGFTGTNTFTLALFFVDHPPTIDFIGRQVVAAGDPLGPITFSVHDVDTPISSVTVRAGSDNQKLIPDGNIVLQPTGTAGQYTLLMFPIGTASGSANITVTANDGTLSTSETFNVFVQVPDNPLFAAANAITINAGAPGSPYGSTNHIPAGTLIGTVEKVTVTLFGITDPTPGNLQALLVGPTGAKVLLMSGVGGNNALNGATLNFDDSASSSLPTSSQIISGVYKPTQATSTSLPAPAPASPYGTVLNTTFAGTNPNGDWVLYINDTGSAKGGLIASGWQLSIQTAPNIPPIKDQFTTENQSTNVTITVGDNQPGVALTVTATGDSSLFQLPIAVSGSGATRTLTIVPQPFAFGTNIISVTAKDALGNTANGSFNMGVAFAAQPPLFTDFPGDQSVPAATQLGPIALSVWSPQGSTLTVTASSTDNPGLVPSVQIAANGSTSGTNHYNLSLIPAGTGTGTATITVVASDSSGLKAIKSFKLTVTGNNVFGNTGAISIPPGPTTPGQLQQGEATPYPSPINIKGLGGVINSIQVALVGLTHQHPEDLDILLVGPDGTTAVMLMAHAGQGAGASGLRLTFDDTAATAIPQSSALNSQSYKPADYSSGVVLPSPAAARPYATALSAFQGMDPNGTWSLYVLDDTYPTGGSIDNGWLLYLTTAPAIAAIGDQVTTENTPLSVSINVSDASTDPTNITVSAASSGDFPPSGLVSKLKVTGTGPNLTLTITPTANMPSTYNAQNGYTNAPGTNLITLTATDTVNKLTTTESFGFKVLYVNQSPTITTATNSVYVNENSSTTIAYTVGDVDSIMDRSNIVVTSSDQSILANSNIVVTGSAIAVNATGTINVKVTPNPNTYGSVTLSFVGTDGNTFTTNLLTLNVNHVWQAPTISSITSPQPVIAGSSTTNITFTVGSVEVPTKNLLVYAKSDNTALVPNTSANIVLSGAGDNRAIQLFTIGSSTATAHITVFVTDLSITNNNSTNSTTFTLNATTVNNQFANTAAITTSGANKANIYPSTIPVSGLVGATFKVDVVLPDFNHNAPANLDVLLVSENTDNKTNAVVLMSGAGGTNPVSNVRLTFDDSGSLLPTAGLATGTYQPANYTKGLILPGPAPTNGLWSPTLTSAFAGLNPNGNWKLFVNDRGAGDSGNISQGWQLVIQTAPTISSSTASPLNITENGNGTVNLTVGDMAIDVSNLVVSVSSDNTVLVPTRNVTFSSIVSAGHSGTLTATVTPASLQNGTANLTFIVTRSDGATSSTKLAVHVTAVNVPSTISRLDNITMPENTTSNIVFIVGDVDTPLSNITVQATSGAGDQTLLPSTSLVFVGYGTNKLIGLPPGSSPQSSLLTLQIKPAAFQVGTATVTITVTDPQPVGTNTVTSSFVVTVQKVDYPPYFITSPGAQTVAAGGTLSGIAFQVASPTAAATTLTMSGKSSDQTVVKDANITFGGSGTNRTVNVTAESVAGGGTATITLTVTDPANSKTATTTFALTVRPPRVRNYANNHIINIIDNSAADLYPSKITVSGLAGPISKLTATLNGFTHSFPSDVGVLLVSPAGQRIVLMNNLGGGHPGANNVNLTFDQSAAASIPINGPVTAGSYLPLDNSGSSRTFVAPAPGTPYTNTLNGFNGSNPNGDWLLYVEDFTPPDAGAISNGWAIAITTLPVINGLTDVVTNENAVATENFTVADDTLSTPVFNFSATSDNQAVVADKGISFSGSGTNFSIAVTPVANASGSANITVTMVNGDGQTITAKFKATFNPVFYPPTIAAIADVSIPAGAGAVVPLNYSDIGVPQGSLTVSFASSNTNLIKTADMKQVGTNLLISPVGVGTGSSTITVTVTNPNNQSTNTSFALNILTNSTNVFAATGAIVINDNAPATPYPSTINVSGLPTNILQVTATLVGMGHQYPSDVSILLVGPQGQKVVLQSRAGGSVSFSDTRVTFDDNASAVLPQFSLIADGTYKPTDYKTSDTFFSPAPVAPYGHALSDFIGTNPNGTWSLYVQDDQAQESGIITGGWVLAIKTPVPPNAPPTIAGLPTQTSTGANVPLLLRFTIGDVDDALSNLVVSASVSNTNLGIASVTPRVSTQQILSYTPAGVLGTNVVTVTVSDGVSTTTNSFNLVVTNGTLPVISSIANQTITNSAAGAIVNVAFSVNTGPLGASNLTVVASADNTTLVPVITVTATNGTNFSAAIQVAPSLSGKANISVLATDQYGNSTAKFVVSAGLPPVIAAIPPQGIVGSISAGVVLKVNFVVDTGALGPSGLKVTGKSDNAALVSGVFVSGSNGTNFTATVNMIAGVSGKANISLVASNQFGATTNQFPLTVALPPIIAAIPAQSITNTSSGATLNVKFTVDTGVTGATNLIVTASADNTNLVKTATVSGNGTNFTAALSLAPSLSGSANITVTATDEFGSGTNQFALTVTAPSTTTPASLKLTASGNQLTLTVSGSANASYEIQSSTDLKNWINLTNITANASGTASFTATVSASNKDLFVRAKNQ